ncbi:hypothetical protein SDC9_174386 [bioreactor metagenome]|uniref:Uncharacterized protein n=1 Tax=bioreactor metagenome TaxID=1076179 RepID=A0A645GLC8_9ZZZZ
MLDDKCVSARLIYQIVQSGICLFVGNGVGRTRMGCRLRQSRLQLRSLLRVDAPGRQARQHAFQFGKSFHHRNQLTGIEVAHVDANARKNAHHPLGR